MINHPNRSANKRNDLTPYMPALPATAADLKPSKALTIIDRADKMLDDDEIFQRVKAGEDKINGHSATSVTAMFSWAYTAQDLVNTANERGDEIMGQLTPEEMHRAMQFAKRRRGFNLRQRRKLAIAYRQKAEAEALASETNG